MNSQEIRETKIGPQDEYLCDIAFFLRELTAQVAEMNERKRKQDDDKLSSRQTAGKWDVLSKKAFPTKRLAQRELNKRVGEVNREDYKPTSTVTFKVFAEKWKASVLIHQKPSAQASDRSHLKVHLKVFNDFPLKDISAEMIQEWVSQMTLEPKTVDNIVQTMRGMWATAKKWSYVTHDPFDGLVLPKKTDPKTYAFSLEETMAIIQRAEEPWKTLFRIVAETGVRSGEVAGLRVEDFDPINLTLAVRQSVWRSKIQTPKSKRSVRREPISSNLSAAIQEAISTAKPNDYGLIFTGQTGKPLCMIHFINRVFAPLLKELGIRAKLDQMGIKKCGLHAFRRMSGTQMDKQGVPLKTRQARMGHASIVTTMNHYTQPIDEASRRFADRMGALLAPNGGRGLFASCISCLGGSAPLVFIGEK